MQHKIGRREQRPHYVIHAGVTMQQKIGRREQRSHHVIQAGVTMQHKIGRREQRAHHFSIKVRLDFTVLVLEGGEPPQVLPLCLLVLHTALFTE
jgi:hypothetical protein